MFLAKTSTQIRPIEKSWLDMKLILTRYAIHPEMTNVQFPLFCYTPIMHFEISHQQINSDLFNHFQTTHQKQQHPTQFPKYSQIFPPKIPQQKKIKLYTTPQSVKSTQTNPNTPARHIKIPNNYIKSSFLKHWSEKHCGRMWDGVGGVGAGYFWRVGVGGRMLVVFFEVGFGWVVFLGFGFGWVVVCYIWGYQGIKQVGQYYVIVKFIYFQQALMNPTKTYVFFDSKSKKAKKPTQQTATNHSRSLSAKSDLTKNSARNRPIPQKPQNLPVSKKQKQIREAIQYRYRKSKMREYQLEYRGERGRDNKSRSRSSQMEQFHDMKNIRVVNLKEYHENVVRRKLQEKERNSIRSKLRIRTDSSLIIKTQGSQKSMQKLKFLKSYLQPQLTPTKLQSSKPKPPPKPPSKQDWKFISIQQKQKLQNKQQTKTKNKQLKINSHRTITVQNQRTRMKTVESQWDFVPKLKDLGKLSKKYRF